MRFSCWWVRSLCKSYPPCTHSSAARPPRLAPFSLLAFRIPASRLPPTCFPYLPVSALAVLLSSRLPPPPLPARPASVERSSPALAKLQSSPDLIRGVGTGAGGAGALGPAGGVAMPPPLPDRPSNAAFENADLQAIRESNASSLR